MNISKEAIEAAEKSLRDEGLDDVGNPPHGWRCEYPDLYPGYCTCVTDLARAALEAAAPLLMAQAWNEGAKAMKRAVSEEQSVSFIMPNNPYRKETS